MITDIKKCSYKETDIDVTKLSGQYFYNAMMDCGSNYIDQYEEFMKDYYQTTNQKLMDLIENDEIRRPELHESGTMMISSLKNKAIILIS